MPLKLTRRVKKVLEILFEEPQLSALALRLEDEVSENIPLHHDSSPAGMDRIRFSILKLIANDEADEERAFSLAKVDWRDLFQAAGMDDASEHNRWYRSLVKDSQKAPSWWFFWRR